MKLNWPPQLFTNLGSPSFESELWCDLPNVLAPSSELTTYEFKFCNLASPWLLIIAAVIFIRRSDFPYHSLGLRTPDYGPDWTSLNHMLIEMMDQKDDPFTDNVDTLGRWRFFTHHFSTNFWDFLAASLTNHISGVLFWTPAHRFCYSQEWWKFWCLSQSCSP
jgi:hypothetical protein